MLHKAIKKSLCNVLYIIYVVVTLESLMKNCFMHVWKNQTVKIQIPSSLLNTVLLNHGFIYNSLWLTWFSSSSRAILRTCSVSRFERHWPRICSFFALTSFSPLKSPVSRILWDFTRSISCLKRKGKKKDCSKATTISSLHWHVTFN